VGHAINYIELAGAPRFSRTPPALSRPPPMPGEHTDEVLTDYGFGPDEIAALRRSAAVI
jgi:alpha-methylacyl-CoA racemase